MKTAPKILPGGSTTIMAQLGRDNRGRKALPPTLVEGDVAFSPQHLERIELELMAIQRKAVEISTDISLAEMAGATEENDEALAAMIIEQHVYWTGWQILVKLKKKMLQGVETAKLSLKGSIRQLKDVMGRAQLAKMEDPSTYKANAAVEAARAHLRDFCRLVPLLGFSLEEMELGAYSRAFRNARVELNRQARQAREEVEDKHIKEQHAVKVKRPKRARGGRSAVAARQAVATVGKALKVGPVPGDVSAALTVTDAAA